MRFKSGTLASPAGFCDSSPTLQLHELPRRRAAVKNDTGSVLRGHGAAGLDADAIQADNREALCLICIGALVAGRRRCDFILQKTER
jgi:hypothetical protein